MLAHLEHSRLVFGDVLNHTITLEEAEVGAFTVDSVLFCCASAHNAGCIEEKKDAKSNKPRTCCGRSWC